MIEVRFHEELYDALSLDEAVKTYEPYAKLTAHREPGGATVRIEAIEGGADEALIAAELGNFALGRAIERSRNQAPPANEAA